jgi:hypothetical protein
MIIHSCVCSLQAQEYLLNHALEPVLEAVLGYAVQDQPPAHQAAVIEV